MVQRNKTKIQIKQQAIQTRWLIAGGLGLGVGLVFLVLWFFQNPEDAKASGICGNDITGTYTVSQATSCSNEVTVDGGILYVDAPLNLSHNLVVENSGEVVVRTGGSITITGSHTLLVDGSTFTINGLVDVDGDIDFEGGSTLTINYGGELLNSGDAKFTMQDRNTEITVNPGGYFIVGESVLKGSSFTNNGYVEQLDMDNGEKMRWEIDMDGSGVFYCFDKSKVQLTKGSRIMTNNKGALADDMFVCGSKTLNVKRVPKFKADYADLELGDSFRVEDTLNLNGERIDVKTHDFRMPKGQSFSRQGNITEYIQTTNSGKYKFIVSKNQTKYTAPIGRNPYLPIVVECTDCQGTEFAVNVTEGVFQNPEDQTGAQSSFVVGETWSVIPDKTFSGSVTFELQWNAGANSTVNSEESGFDRTQCTPVYWVSGSSTSWNDDGSNVNIGATGTDPYSVPITINGMVGGQTYYFGVGSAGSALPVEFTHFEVEMENGKPLLSWGTAMEKDNDYFEVQRSTNGSNWEKIGEVKGAGNTMAPQSYEFMDEETAAPQVFYRLRQVDYSGDFDFSKTVSINLNDNGTSQNALVMGNVFPNPVQNQLTLPFTTSNAGEVQIMVSNSAGKVLYNKRIQAVVGENEHQISFAQFENGIYLLQVAANGKIMTQKVQKQ